MFKDCLEVFEKNYKAKGDQYILDGYILGEGTYVLVGQDLKVKQILEITKSKEKVDETLEGYDQFCYMDYYSYYLDSNKCIDSAKLIHSNNYLSFMVKKENVISGKLTQEHIAKHYDLLAHPEKKYKGKKKSLALYQEVEKQIGPIDLVKLEECAGWIKEHLFTLLKDYDIKGEKGYLKIFFEPEEMVFFEKESYRYVMPNVYNATDYNVMIENKIYGVPNDNMGLNSKKPYLKHMSRINSVPYLIDMEEVLLQKKFMDFLKSEATKGHYNIYLSDKGIIGLSGKEFLTKENCSEQGFTGYFLRIMNGDKGLVIIDNDYILRFSPILQDFYIKRSLPINYMNKETEISYGEVRELSKVAQLINKRFFKGFLSQSYFGDLPDKAKKESDFLQAAIMQSRDAFFMWFYKGQTQAIRQSFNKLSLELIKDTIMHADQSKSVMTQAREQWILRDAVNTYFNKGGVHMGDQLAPVYEALEEKVMGKCETIITSDEEYFCAVGQLAYYLLTHNKSGKKTHALLNPILNARDDLQIKEQLRRLFVKYNYDILQGAGRFNRLYAMITAYNPGQKIMQDALLYGYLQENLLYKSSKNVADEVEENVYEEME